MADVTVPPQVVKRDNGQIWIVIMNNPLKRNAVDAETASRLYQVNGVEPRQNYKFLYLAFSVLISLSQRYFRTSKMIAQVLHEFYHQSS